MSVWYPYSQMKCAAPNLEVVSASAEFLDLRNGHRLIDAISSWWCMIHGYSHPKIVAAMVAQTQRLPHVMLGGLTHQPALELATVLARVSPGELTHVFYSDSGSVGVEVAMKMAVQFYRNQGNSLKRRFVSLKHAYHGDTFGSMSVCDPVDSMHHLFTGSLLDQIGLPEAPELGASPARIRTYLQSVESILREVSQEVCAIIVEPIMQGAGGFKLYDPSVLVGFRELAERYDMVLIFDEVATGFGRLGRLFAADLAGVVPDIMILGKALTGGHIGLAATIATPRIFNQFWSDNPEDALMHGPTFMGNPIACTAALANIELISDLDSLTLVAEIESKLLALNQLIESPYVKAVRVLGAMGVVEVVDSASLADIQSFAVSRGVWLRPFGTVVYTTPPYIISDESLQKIVEVILDYFQQHLNR